MPTATQIIFRRLTESDFFNINSLGLGNGGGQSYIDVSTATVSRKSWEAFLAPLKPNMGAQNRPYWSIAIRSVGLNTTQHVDIGERRAASFNIRSQKLFSNAGNRIKAWQPAQGFPAPQKPFKSSNDPTITPMMKNLTVYLVRDEGGVIWAGWHNCAEPPPEWKMTLPLKRLFDQHTQDGIIKFDKPIAFHPENATWPFTAAAGIYPSSKTNEEFVEDLFADDEMPDDGDIQYKTQKVRKRNTKAVAPLKKLYNWRCQITGEEFAFESAKGARYVEAHHLVPLGKGGADAPHNLIIVSAHIHKMLHFAKVSEIDLTKIKDNKLAITIGGEAHTITWHKDHAAKVLAAAA